MKHLEKTVAAAFALLISVCASGSSPVKPVSGMPAPGGLDDRNIALWQSHGLYYNLKKDTWIWQRAHLLQTIEDLYSASYVIDLLAPMLENAGAYVMLPRERDTNSHEAIADPDSPLTPGYSETNGTKKWQDAPVKGFAMTSGPLYGNDNPFDRGKARMVETVAANSAESTASWDIEIPQDGTYSVYVSYPSMKNSSSAVTYTVNSLRGSEQFIVDQTMGGGTWMRLGEFPFAKGHMPTPAVTMSNTATGKNIGKIAAADAVRIGGGMGNVARGKDLGRQHVSGRPRWMEGARYWLQYAGFPADVYAPEESSDEYEDDFRCRPLWVNYLAGGSSKIPKGKGLNIPVDLALALHTDAGITPDTTIIGTLGIYSTDGGSRLGDGRRRTTNRVLTESVVNQIVNDLRALYQPGWTRRKIRDRRYAEARIPKVPATLIELLSHQNMADMRLGHDPQFRFDAARAIYKGILRYLSSSGKKRYVVQPLPVNSFAIDSDGHGKYTLTWKPTDDPLEPTAAPTKYIVEQRIGDGAFIPWATVTVPRATFDNAVEGIVYSFRIIAANDGGRSFPSEVLALCRFENGNPEVLVINGFTRVSAPESFDSEGEAGFLDELDHGVPYIRNIAYSGQQYDFDRESPWVDDIVQPGFGASASDFDGTIIAGNTFDFTAVHGRSIAAAGFPFISSGLDGYLASAPGYDRPIIDLILGKQRETKPGNGNLPTRFKAFSPQLQRRLSDHASSGRNMLVSGSFIGADIFHNTFSNDSVRQSDSEFARRVLGINYESEFGAVSGVVEVLPFWTNGQRKGTIRYSNIPNEHIYVVESPDAISPADPVNTDMIMIYDENRLGAAVARHDSPGTSVTMGFPFESIVDSQARDMLMKQLLTYLTTVKIKIAPQVTSTQFRNVVIPVDDPDPKPALLNIEQ